MSERHAWNRRYAEGEYVPRSEPSSLLMEWLEHLPPGRALDVACGTGRNALYLAENGYAVDAVDISEVAIDRGRGQAEGRDVDITWHVSDLDTFQVAPAAYDVITVFRYRNPELWPRLLEGLADNGWLVAEHHFKSRLDVAGPSTLEFRLDPQELLHAFASLRIVHYAETLESADLDAGQYAIARLVACRGDPGF